MIVGCYTLELYCDICWADISFSYARRITFPHRYCGKNREEVTQKAKEDGWKVTHFCDEEAQAICPDCNYS